MDVVGFGAAVRAGGTACELVGVGVFGDAVTFGVAVTDAAVTPTLGALPQAVMNTTANGAASTPAKPDLMPSLPQSTFHNAINPSRTP
jgi:hypothetical protein